MFDRTPMPDPAAPRSGKATRAIDAVCAALTRLHTRLARWLTQAIRWLWIRQNRLSLPLRFCVAAAGLALMAAMAAWCLPGRFAARVGFYVERGEFQLVMHGIDPLFTVGKLAAERARLAAEKALKIAQNALEVAGRRLHILGLSWAGRMGDPASSVPPVIDDVASATASATAMMARKRPYRRPSTRRLRKPQRFSSRWKNCRRRLWNTLDRAMSGW